MTDHENFQKPSKKSTGKDTLFSSHLISKDQELIVFLVFVEMLWGS